MDTYERHMKQIEKIGYISSRICERLWAENCTEHEYREILKQVEQTILNKSIFSVLEIDE